MFYRSILPKLQEWKNSKDRKPLVLRGARQVGKTTAVNIFSENFDNYIYLNLEILKDRNIFREELSVKTIFQSILIEKGMILKQGSCLLFIDEIQNSPVAVKMLRYFYEDMKEIYVIAAGSLLEVVMGKNNISFPAGRIDFLYLYPLSFNEFLNAKKEDQALGIYNSVPFKSIAHDKLLGLFHKYAQIGGMPEIINKYIVKDLSQNSITSLNRIYESLTVSYVNDAEKYAENQNKRNILRHCIDAIPFESGHRIKFQGFGNSNYRSIEISESLRILERAMLIYLIYPTTSTTLPVMPDQKKSPILQHIDTGMLNYYAGLQGYFFKFDDLHSFYKGQIAEHIVRQEIIANDMTTKRKPVFWVREKKQSNSEVDLIFTYKNYCIPVEIKSGKSGTLRSLHQFIDRADHSFGIRLFAAETSIERTHTIEGKKFTLLNLPYYLASKLKENIEYYFEI